MKKQKGEKAYIHTLLGNFILKQRLIIGKSMTNMAKSMTNMAMSLGISDDYLSSIELGKVTIDHEMYLKIKKYFKLKAWEVQAFNQAIRETKQEEADEIITGKFRAYKVDELPL